MIMTSLAFTGLYKIHLIYYLNKIWFKGTM